MTIASRYTSFTDVFLSLDQHFRLHSQLVHTEKWQGMDIRKKPEAATYELMNVCFSVPMATESLEWYRQAIKPNLPWADDHFLERVCGEPLNPGKEWRNWPWALSADNFREGPRGPLIPIHDWAYLAGMIDGEGCIYFRDTPHFQGKIIVYQSDPAVLHYLHELFKVGKVVRQSDHPTELNSRIHKNEMWRWQISAIAEVTWVLENVVSLLRIKKDKAVAMSERLKYRQTEEGVREDAGAPRKLLWGKEWEPRFNHSYMSRYWPKKLDSGSDMRGHHWAYGDLNDVVELLHQEPLTRQAWMPIFFPEDTGIGDGGRKPCTLGYQFLLRGAKLHIYYPLRSCDYYRHFRDDIYLTIRLLLWVLDRLREKNRHWNAVTPGDYTMHCTSLHLFRNDYHQMFGEGQ